MNGMLKVRLKYNQPIRKIKVDNNPTDQTV